MQIKGFIYLSNAQQTHSGARVWLFFLLNIFFISSGDGGLCFVPTRLTQVWTCFSCRVGKSSIMNIAASSYAHIKPSWMQRLQVNRVGWETFKGILGNARIFFFVFLNWSWTLFWSKLHVESKYVPKTKKNKTRLRHEHTLKPCGVFISAARQVDLLHGSWAS